MQALGNTLWWVNCARALPIGHQHDLLILAELFLADIATQEIFWSSFQLILNSLLIDCWDLFGFPFCSHFSHYSLCANHSLFAILTHYFLGFESFRNIFDAHETWSVAAFAAKRPGFVLFRCGSLLVAHYWVRLTIGSGLN